MLPLVAAAAIAQEVPTEVRVDRATLAPLLDLEQASVLFTRRRGGPGLALRSVPPGLSALGLRRGDVPLTRDGRPIRGAEGAEILLRKLLTDRTVGLAFLRDGTRHDVLVRIDGPPLSIPGWWTVTPDDAAWRAYRGIEITAVELAVPRRSLLVDERDDGTPIPALGTWRHTDDGGFSLGTRRGGLARSLGIAPGERILAANGQPLVDAAAVVALHQALMTDDLVTLRVRGPEGSRTLVWHLDGPPLDLVVTTADVHFGRDGDGPAGTYDPTVDLAAAAAGLQATTHRNGYGEPDGVRLTGLTRGSPLARMGLRDRDVVTAVGGVPVHDLEAFLTALTRAAAAGGTLRVDVLRRGEPLAIEAAPAVTREE